MIKNAILGAAARALISTVVIGGVASASTAAFAATAKEIAIEALKTALKNATNKQQIAAAVNAAKDAGLTKAEVSAAFTAVIAELPAASGQAAALTQIQVAIDNTPVTASGTVTLVLGSGSTDNTATFSDVVDTTQPSTVLDNVTVTYTP